MTIVLERFADPARRCPPGWPDARAEVRDLTASGRRLGLAARLPAALVDWARCDRRGELLRACVATRGARAGALVHGPALWRASRAGALDGVACRTAKDFGLVDALAARSGGRPSELLATRTSYVGEFAFELLAVVPYAHWLHERGLLESTASTADTRCLYYFSPHHEELPGPRRYVPVTDLPIGVAGWWRYDRKAFPRELDTSRWSPPPYRDVYRDGRFAGDRPLCVVANKASDERYLHRGFSVNAIPTDVLLALLARLRTRYRVVYARPRAADIVNDHQEVREPGDLEAVKAAYPDVTTIQELAAAHPELGFNELQLRLLASSQRFVSVLGGSSYLASWFGGVNVVYARHGWEVRCGAYERWFHRFSGARVVRAGSPRALLATVERELLAP
ncbi:MAG: hypothetical protein R3C15_21575 [Thermoleophilia bacterium]